MSWGWLRGGRWAERTCRVGVEPKYIEAGDRKILYSGMWCAARHFNYLGEGFISLSMALGFGHFNVVWAWLYFAFALTMFTTRQRDDDRHCAEKYGAEKWAEYKSRVKYRIFPGVYQGRPAASTQGGEDAWAEPEPGCAQGLRISALRSPGTRRGASLSPAPFN